MNEDIAQELNRMANSQGKTLYSLINEIGMSAIEASKNGFSLEEAMRAKKLMDRAKRSRMVLVNQDLWYFASTEAYKWSNNKWLKQVYEGAQWQANVFLGGVSGIDFIDSLRKLLADFHWDCSDIKIEEVDEENLSVRLAFVPEMPLQHTKALFKGFEGLFNARGYAATDSAVGHGFLTATFKKVGQT